LYQQRVAHRQMNLDNPQQQSATRRERDERRKRKQQEAHLKKLKLPKRTERGMWKLKKEERRFDVFVRLHNMWMDYMSELLALKPALSSAVVDPNVMPSAAGMHAKLVKADFHGAYLTVRQSKNYALVGLAGIVIHETENTFRVITRKNQVKQIPKHGSIFAFAVPLYSTHSDSPDPTLESGPVPTSETASDPVPTRIVLDIPHIEFDLYGNQFQFRSADRAGRKFKAKESIEL
ncbi:Rof/RNase P-like protein, partial [Vararia minispora EC-137]